MMRRGHKTVRGLAGWVALALAAGSIPWMAAEASGQDWPQWRGENRDGRLSGFVAPEAWPETLSPVWSVDVGDANATPALVGDRLYVFVRQGDSETLLALDAGDGSEIWSERYEAPAVTGAARGHSGPRSSPTVAEGKVVTLGVTGILSCVNAADGSLAWRKDVFPGLYPTFYTGMSPLIVDGTCIAHLGSESEGALVAFDLATGEEQWRWEGDGPSYSSPVVATIEGTPQIVVVTASTVAGVALEDGSLLWQIDFGGGRGYNSATPIVDGSMVFCTSQGPGTVALRIARSAGGFTAERVWTNERLASGFNTPVLKDGRLFGLTGAGTPYCLDASTGEEVWHDPTRLDRFGSILDGGSILLALGTDGELIAYLPSAEGFEVVARMGVAESATYAHPVISGNRIFVKDQESLTLFRIGPESR